MMPHPLAFPQGLHSLKLLSQKLLKKEGEGEGEGEGGGTLALVFRVCVSIVCLGVCAPSPPGLQCLLPLGQKPLEQEGRREEEKGAYSWTTREKKETTFT